MATCKTAGNQLFRRFIVSEGLYPGNSLAELWQGLLYGMRPLQVPEWLKVMSKLEGVHGLLGLARSFLWVWAERREEKEGVRETYSFQLKS